MTDLDGLKDAVGRLSEYSPPEPKLTERTLSREAEIQNEKLPIRTRSHLTSFMIDNVPFQINGDFQYKVGAWEWGDTLLFVPQSVNVAGAVLPVMPLRLASELYLTLGWLDRVEMISDAVARAHHALHQESGGDPVY